MKPTDTCIRIRDSNEGEIDVENFIKNIEDKFKIDFKRLPQWKHLIEKLYFVSDYKEKIIEGVNLRKLLIIQKLCLETTRLTPFELTERLLRTVDVWQKSPWRNRLKQQKTNNLINIEGPLPSIQSSVKTTDLMDTPLSGLEETAEEATILDDKENEPNNQQRESHSSDSNYSELSYHSLRSGDVDATVVSHPTVCHSLNFKLIECEPKELVISNNYPLKQTIKFSLKNTSSDCIFVRFKDVTNRDLFQRANVVPYIPVKLYPGLSKGFKFFFNLKLTKEDFLTNLTYLVQFKDGNENILSEYCVGISTKFKNARYTKVTEIVHIPPVYSWHLNPKFGYPFGILTVEGKGDHDYDVIIIKRKKDLAEIESFNSSNATMQTITGDLVNEINTSFIQKSLTVNEVGVDPIDNFMLSLVKDVIEIALDKFIFDLTCLRLPKNSKRKTSVYFIKCEYVGYHQSYFDVEFRNVETYELIETKTTKVFAEVLPHPIEISPTIFDMSHSPVVHGVCVDHFVISNRHNIFSSTIKIHASNITKKLITINPITVCIQPETSVKFQIRTCPSKQPFDKELKVMVHFTLKITATGMKSVYDKMPPIFYEIIAPCTLGFCEMYDLLPHSELLFEEPLNDCPT